MTMSQDATDTMKSIGGLAITGTSAIVANSAMFLPVAQFIAACIAIVVGSVTLYKTLRSMKRGK